MSTPANTSAKSLMILSQADARPIYLQIMEEIKRRVALGDWSPGFKLPSIRELASDLQVSVITVKRAYLELERAGVIDTRQGRGSYVSQGLSDEHALDDVRTAELTRSLEAVAGLARTMGIGGEELISMLKHHLKD